MLLTACGHWASWTSLLTYSLAYWCSPGIWHCNLPPVVHVFSCQITFAIPVGARKVSEDETWLLQLVRVYQNFWHQEYCIILGMYCSSYHLFQLMVLGVFFLSSELMIIKVVATLIWLIITWASVIIILSWFPLWSFCFFFCLQNWLHCQFGQLWESL